MVHTGDSIDAGTIQELYQFIYISDKLQMIPWLNLVGNHDVAIFGNYQERIAYAREAGVNFYPVGDLTNFVWMHRKQRVISGFGWHLLPAPSEGGHSPSEGTWPGKKLPPTEEGLQRVSAAQVQGHFPQPSPYSLPQPVSIGALHCQLSRRRIWPSESEHNPKE